ncbi:aldehyde dehydrogenase family protein [Peribacillus simplex]|jgi:acyl-CoA reductase-like NAD-dependent aldehyde dehydrogenase|uniref:aldehyde dehydrogenase family protein n=1 Tax=Peribacillus TaxID=2675229 RepID=UPI0037F6F23E
MYVAKIFRTSSYKPQWNTIQELINKGIEEIAKIIAGCSSKPEGLDGGYYVKSTLFADVTNEMTIICTVIINLRYIYAI